MPIVTDPAILEQLNGGGTPVTDPAILAQLNGTDQPAAGKPVTDPAILAQLNGTTAPTPEPGDEFGAIRDAASAPTPRAPPAPYSQRTPAVDTAPPSGPTLAEVSGQVKGVSPTQSDIDSLTGADREVNAMRPGPTLAAFHNQKVQQEAPYRDDPEAHLEKVRSSLTQEAAAAPGMTSTIEDVGNQFTGAVEAFKSGTGAAMTAIANDKKTSGNANAKYLASLFMDTDKDGKYVEPQWSVEAGKRQKLAQTGAGKMSMHDAIDHGEFGAWFAAKTAAAVPTVGALIAASIFAPPAVIPLLGAMGFSQAGEMFKADMEADPKADAHNVLINSLSKAAILTSASMALPIALSKFAAPMMSHAARMLPEAEATSLLQQNLRAYAAAAIAGTENVSSNVAGSVAGQAAANLSDQMIGGKDTPISDSLLEAAVTSILPAAAFFGVHAVPHLARTAEERHVEVVMNRAFRDASQPGIDISEAGNIIRKAATTVNPDDVQFVKRKLVQVVQHSDDTKAAAERGESLTPQDDALEEQFAKQQGENGEQTAGQNKLDTGEAPSNAGDESARNAGASRAGEPELREESDLRTDLNKYSKDIGLDGAIGEGKLRIDHLSPEEQTVSDVGFEVFGRKLRLVTIEGGGDKIPAGFVSKKYPDTVYLRRDAGDNPIFTYAHEMGHGIAEDHPDLYKEWLAATKADGSFLNVEAAEKFHGVKGAAAEKEMFSDHLGRLMNDEKFAQSLSDAHPELFGKLVSALKEMWDKWLFGLTKRLPPDSKWVKETKVEKDRLFKLLSEVARRSKEKEAQSPKADEPIAASKERNEKPTREARTIAFAKHGRKAEEVQNANAARQDVAARGNREPVRVRAEQPAVADGQQAGAGGLHERAGLRGGVRVLDESRGENPRTHEALEGLPKHVEVDGEKVEFGPHAPARDAADAYMKSTGREYTPPTKFIKVNPERATRIANAFTEMKHDPSNPEVKAAYRAMIDETMAQWEEIKKTGLKVEFNNGTDPYGNPRNAIRDVVDNNHLYVFSTEDGFGSDKSVDVSDNPLLEKTAEMIGDRPALANDIFRIVHDYFGHVKEGVGFRADGEDNAWRSHAAMYSDLARKAMTTETRGQNSWVNFGPDAEHNKTASGADTIYADQKIGLMPDWVGNEKSNISSAVDLRESESKSPLGKNPNVEDVGRYFDKKHGPAGDYKNPEDFKKAVAQARHEFEHQLTQPKSGLDWYSGDIKDAYELTKQFIPELENESHRQMFSVMTAIMSPESKAHENWVKAGEAYRHFLDSGKFPETNPYSGETWGAKTGSIKAQAIGHLNSMIEAMGHDATVEWLLTKHPVSELRAMKLEFGAYKGHNIDGKRTDERFGADIFGPKVGAFMLNINGFDTAVTIDKWLTRTFNRYFGTIMDKNGVMTESPSDVQRPFIKKLIEQVANDTGHTPSETQAVLWFFEQQTYNKLGAGSKSYSFSDGARELLDANGIGSQRTGSEDNGRGSGDHAAASDGGAEGDVAFSRTRTPEFKKWFGESKQVDEEGKPKVWYHGTAQDIKAFQPKQAGAIFLTDDPKFAHGFSGSSADYMIGNAEAILRPEQLSAIKAEVFKRIDALDETPGEKELLKADYKAQPIYRNVIKDMMPSNENTMPLFVRAEKTFDYDNGSDREQLINRLFRDVHQYTMGDGKQALVLDGKKTLYSRDVVDHTLGKSELSNWDFLESPAVQGAIKSLGYDSFYVSEAGYKNLAVYDPNQVKSASGNSGKYSTEDSNIAASKERAEHFDLPEQSKANKGRQTFVDRYERVWALMKAVKEQGGNVTDANNVAYALRRLPGVSGARAGEFMEKEAEPVIVRAAKLKVKMEDAIELLVAEHAQERNEQVAKINPKMPDGGSGLTTADAAEIIRGYRDSKDYLHIREVADSILKITRDTGNLLKNEGLIDEEMHTAWTDAYKRYVPLRGGDGTDAGDRNYYGQGKQLGSNGKVVKRALGRYTQVDSNNVWANIVNDRFSAIVRSEKNNAGKVLFKFALDNPDQSLFDIFPIKKSRVFSKTTGQVEETNVGDHGENVVPVMIKGKLYHVKVKDQALADQLLGMNRQDMDSFMQNMGTINRMWVKMWTQYNPAFPITNTIRDVHTAVVHSLAQYGAGRVAKVLGDLGPAGKAMWDWERGRRHGVEGHKGEWAKTVEEFVNNGGKVGAVDQLGLHERVRQLQTMYKDADGGVWRTPQKMGNALLQILSDFNGAGENAIRVATYKAARDSGASIQEAVNQARTIRVDFNQHGDLAPQLNAMYLFFNPAMQETARIYDVVKKHPKTMAAIVGSQMLIGFANAMMSSRDTDEDGVAYWDKPEYQNKKQRGLVMIRPGSGGQAIVVPLPYGYGFFFNMGAAMADKVRGAKDDWDIAKSLAGNAMTQWSPIGGNVGGAGASDLMPSFFHFVSGVVNNENDMGGKIAPGDDNIPSSERYRPAMRGSPQQRVTTWLNSATGGDEHIPGRVSVSPEYINYLVRYTMGGAGDAVNQIGSSMFQAAAGAAPDWERLPLVKQMYIHGHHPERDSGLYYQRTRDLKTAVADYRDAIKVQDSDKQEALEDRFGTEMLTTVADAMKAAQSAIKDLRAQEIELADSDEPRAAKQLQQKEIDRKRGEIYTEFNQLFTEHNTVGKKGDTAKLLLQMPHG